MANTVTTTQQFTADKIAADAAAKKSKAAGATNPNAQLDSDAFMTLLLTELQYQDPTDPMDTEKMLTQTSQLASLEMQTNMNDTMQELVNQLQTSSSMYALSALGKMASLSEKSLNVGEETTSLDIAVHIPTDASSATMHIYDNAKNEVASIDMGEVKAGTNSATWNLALNDGSRASEGKYTADVSYVDADGKTHTAAYGSYPVEAVKFVDNKAQVKVGGKYVLASDVSEFYEG
ncbi:MAG: flagellar basal body rod modification protein [Campylobacter sp.]|nr:flagellar basal body rod modification protein [Campylobacter sp.]